VKRFGKYRRKLWNVMENMDEMWNDMENMEENNYTQLYTVMYFM
jgi:hypothetical protein